MIRCEHGPREGKLRGGQRMLKADEVEAMLGLHALGWGTRTRLPECSVRTAASASADTNCAGRGGMPPTHQQSVVLNQSVADWLVGLLDCGMRAPRGLDEVRGDHPSTNHSHAAKATARTISANPHIASSASPRLKPSREYHGPVRDRYDATT